MSIRHTLAISAAVALSLGTAAQAAQEVTGAATTTTRAMSKAPTAVTQQMRDAAGGQSNNWLHSNGSY